MVNNEGDQNQPDVYVSKEISKMGKKISLPKLVKIIPLIVFFGVLLYGLLYIGKTKLPPLLQQISILSKSPEMVSVSSPLSIEVTIEKDHFSPSTLLVKKGTVVKWTNKDLISHQIASDPHPTHDKLSALLSYKIVSGATFTYKFNQVGTFTYHDENNPLKLRGTIIVE